MFITWQKQEQVNSFNVANGDEPNLILLSLLVLFTFFLISYLALTEINIVRWKQLMILHFSLQVFHFKTIPVLMPVLMGKSRPRSISILANQIREFGSSQPL